MAYVLAQSWPAGEPAGIKIVNDDLKVKDGKPTNCVISTAYLENHFLDTGTLKVLSDVTSASRFPGKIPRRIAVKTHSNTLYFRHHALQITSCNLPSWLAIAIQFCSLQN